MILYVQKLHPADLKSAVEAYLNCLLTPVRAEFESPEMKKMVAKAYPIEKKSESIAFLQSNRNSDRNSDKICPVNKGVKLLGCH